MTPLASGASRSTSARAVVGVLAVVLCLAACGSAKQHTATPTAPVLHGVALANEKAGGACSYLAGAEARPAGSTQAPVGQAMLAHAGTLAIEAQQADARFATFAKDMALIGQPQGAPALARITKFCKKWDAHPTYFLTHAPTS